jgi:hypothetical protein
MHEQTSDFYHDNSINSDHEAITAYQQCTRSGVHSTKMYLNLLLNFRFDSVALIEINDRQNKLNTR